MEERKTLGGCKAGEAKITKGYNLPAKYIIHTVGPVYGKERGEEESLLSSCYENSLMIAKEKGIKTIAFPCISTGVFRFPKDEAAKIAISIAKSFINKYPDAFGEITFVAYTESDFDIYKKSCL